MSDEFTSEDHWKAITLYGRNTATYKMALGLALMNLCEQNKTEVSWGTLSKEFFGEYLRRLDIDSPMPQAGLKGRLTKMERIVGDYKAGKMGEGAAIERVGSEAFDDVIRIFHNVMGVGDISGGLFYRYDFGKKIYLTDETHSLALSSKDQLRQELSGRWGLLEGAFAKMHSNFSLSNDLRQIYIHNATERKNLTGNIEFLQGYQANACFYCGLPMVAGDIHVDHLLPRQVVRNDDVWNLVLAHSHCNEHKSDMIVGRHYVEKLIQRNENVMGSNHPMKKEIEDKLGASAAKRRKATVAHYDNVGAILSWNYWNGDAEYRVDEDPFYKSLITRFCNKGK